MHTSWATLSTAAKRWSLLFSHLVVLWFRLNAGTATSRGSAVGKRGAFEDETRSWIWIYVLLFPGWTTWELCTGDITQRTGLLLQPYDNEENFPLLCLLTAPIVVWSCQTENNWTLHPQNSPDGMDQTDRVMSLLPLETANKGVHWTDSSSVTYKKRTEGGKVQDSNTPLVQTDRSRAEE